MKIMLTGGSGQLGHVLNQRLAPLGQILAPPREQLDLSDEAALREFIRTVRPDLIVNAAAYTAVDQAQSETALAHTINAHVPQVIAQEAQQLGAPLVHFSTDYVFDGSSARPYREDDATAPLNVYGHSKLAGELAVAANCDAHWIIRTSWVYGRHGSNFLNTMLRLARERDHITVVNDQFGAPTWTHTIADALASMMAGTADLPTHIHSTAGLYHLSAGGATSWHNYAKTILRHLHEYGLATQLEQAGVTPVPSSGYPSIAVRPKNSQLDTGKIERVFGLHLPQWDEALQQCLQDMLKKK